MRTEKQINEQIEKAIDSTKNLFGMTYQQGVEAALLWVIEDIDEEPIE